MSAKVSKRFDNRFELNEENIRRIHSDIRKRTPPENHKDIIFEVFREDSLVFRTSEIDRVLSESNDSTQKIKELKIEYADNSLNILLKFSASDGAELTITGEDRDNVYLISSELKEYIQKEVCHLKSGNHSEKLGAILFFSLMIVALNFLSGVSGKPVDSAELSKILASNDSADKLNYLINIASEKNQSEQKIKYLTFAPFVLMLFIFVPSKKIFNYFFPGNIFLIGKQITVIANRRGNARNIFWGGLVALAIAFLSGYYFFWLSK